MKLKIVSSTGTTERRYGAWIGGSILASLVGYWKDVHQLVYCIGLSISGMAIIFLLRQVSSSAIDIVALAAVVIVVWTIRSIELMFALD